MGYILTTHTDQNILDTVRFVAMVKGACDVVVVENTKEVLARAHREAPDLVILDLENHSEPASRLVDHWYTDTRLRTVPLILLVSASASARRVAPSPLPQGMTYLVKPIDLIELGLRISTLLDPEQRSSTLPPGHQRQLGDLTLDYHLFQVVVNGKTVALTPTEFKLLRHFMENPGQTFSSEQLLDEVWKYPPGVGSLDVVRIYIKRLRDKIEKNPQDPQYIVTMAGHGYRMPAPETTPAQANHPTAALNAALSTNGTSGSQTPAPPLEDILQEVLSALKTVTVTCQATLVTTLQLVEHLSESRVASPNGQPASRGESANGEQPLAILTLDRIAEPDLPAEEIVVAAQSLNRLATELQSKLNQLQAGWSTNPETAVSVGGMG